MYCIYKSFEYRLHTVLQWIFKGLWWFSLWSECASETEKGVQHISSQCSCRLLAVLSQPGSFLATCAIKPYPDHCLNNSWTSKPCPRTVIEFALQPQYYIPADTVVGVCDRIRLMQTTQLMWTYGCYFYQFLVGKLICSNIEKTAPDYIPSLK